MASITNAANWIRGTLFNFYQDALTSNPGYLNSYIRTNMSITIQVTDQNYNPIAGAAISSFSYGYAVDGATNSVATISPSSTFSTLNFVPMGTLPSGTTDANGNYTVIAGGTFDIRNIYGIIFTATYTFVQSNNSTTSPTNPSATASTTTVTVTQNPFSYQLGSGYPWPGGFQWIATMTQPVQAQSNQVTVQVRSSANTSSGIPNEAISIFLTPGADWPPPTWNGSGPAPTPVVLSGSQFSGTTDSNGNVTYDISTSVDSTQPYALVVQIGVKAWDPSVASTFFRYMGNNLAGSTVTVYQ